MNRNLLIIGSGVGLVLLLAIGLSFRQYGTFHLANTDPKDNAATNQYTDITFNFSQALAATGPGVNEISLAPSIEGTTAISDKTVTFTPNGSYTANVGYKVTLKNATSLTGAKLGDITISFNPRYIPYNELPQSIQNKLNIDKTDVHQPYTPLAIGVGGIPALTSHGVTDDQIILLKTAFFRYFQSVKQEIRGLDLTDVVKLPFNKNSASNLDVFNFNVVVNNKTTFKAKLEIGLTTDRLYLSDPTSGKLLFDSGTMNPIEG